MFSIIAIYGEYVCLLPCLVIAKWCMILYRISLYMDHILFVSEGHGLSPQSNILDSTQSSTHHPIKWPQVQILFSAWQRTTRNAVLSSWDGEIYSFGSKRDGAGTSWFHLCSQSHRNTRWCKRNPKPGLRWSWTTSTEFFCWVDPQALHLTWCMQKATDDEPIRQDRA